MLNFEKLTDRWTDGDDRQQAFRKAHLTSSGEHIKNFNYKFFTEKKIRFNLE